MKDNLKQGYDIVFLWNKKGEVDEANYYIIKDDMEKILKKAELFNIN